jgi:transcriptional regulator with XRE-family HTH domain
LKYFTNYFTIVCVQKSKPKRTRLIISPRPNSQRLSTLRADLGWSRAQLAQIMNASDRAIVNWEAGEPISPVYGAKLREIQNVFNELKQLMKPDKIGRWFLSEMDEFQGHTPTELIKKGDTGRLWQSLFYLRSGMLD